MTTGNTLSAGFLNPQVLVDTVDGYIIGNPVMGRTGAVVMNTSLPDTARGGDSVTVPYFTGPGEMADYADGDAIVVTQVGNSSDSSTVVRSGLAVNVTDMTRQLRAYSDPMQRAAAMIGSAAYYRIDKAAVDAASADGLPAHMDIDLYKAPSAGAPVYFDRDVYLMGRGAFGDEVRGLRGIGVHSVTLNRMLKLKDADGRPLYKLISQDDEMGVYQFEGLPPCYMSDRFQTIFPVVSAGTTPPTVTISGYPAGDYNLKIEITTLGTRGVAIFRLSLDGGTTWALTGQTTAESWSNDLYGLTISFAAGTYATNNVYTSTPKYTTCLLKAGAIVSWSAKLNAEDFRDPLRKATIHSAEILHVTHRYTRLPGMRRPGVVRIRHN